MTALRKPARRPEFDEITMGWGADGLEDLKARIALTLELLLHGPEASAAEDKILGAMLDRQVKLEKNRL